MKFYLGTSGYAYKEWKGEFYPEKLATKDMLRFYSGQLNAVEINNTFYQMPKYSVLASWAEQTPEDFTFAVKAHQRITHEKRLENVEEEIDYLFSLLSGLGGKLGPVLFQFPASFHVNPPVLENFLNLIPKDISCAFAFRSSSWINADVLDLLRERKQSLCLEDSDEKPVSEITSTTTWGYLRLRRSNYSEEDLNKWAERINSQEWEKVFAFFKHEDGANSPKMAMRLGKIL